MESSTYKKGIKLLILDILRKEKLHGYGIAEKIEELYGVERPSSGIIYPTLASLKKKGFIRVCKEGNRDKKIYEITEKGLLHLKEQNEELRKVKIMLKNLGEFNKLGGKNLMRSISKLIKNMHKLPENKKKDVEAMLKYCSVNISSILSDEYE